MTAQTSSDILGALIDGADLLDVVGPEGERYLLVSVSQWLLEELELHGADEEDHDNSDTELDDSADLPRAPDWPPANKVVTRRI